MSQHRLRRAALQLALRRSQRGANRIQHQPPGASRAALLGFLVMALLRVLTSGVYAAIPHLASRYAWDGERVGQLFTGMNALSQVLHVIPWALLMLAIFGRRGGAATATPPGTARI